MKKFRFSLDTVLHYKQQILDEIQNEYAALLLEVRRQEDCLEAAEQSYAELNQEFRAAKSAGITVAEALRYEGGLRFNENRIREEEQKLEECRARADEKHDQLVAAHQDTASLEKLKDRKLEAYQKETQRNEEHFIEEVISAAKFMEDVS